ncbi:MAG: phosphotransferase [Pseudomonadota bacterium]
MSPISSTPPMASPSSLLWTDPLRKAQFDDWFARVSQNHQLAPDTLRLASADASFRRYLRVDSAAGGVPTSLIIMDAPPDKGDCKPFANAAELMAQAGLRVPSVLAWDEANGFMLLTDLGTHTMKDVIQPDAPPPLELYLDAVETLIQWQLASREGVLPPYDRAFVMRELELFPQWYIGEYRQVTLDEAQRQVLDKAFAALADSALSWPNVYMHRDFMPRNLMVSEGMAPTLTTACAALPPEGTVSPGGGPAAKLAPTLDTNVSSLLPEDAVSSWGAPAAKPAPLGKPSATRLGVLDFQDAVYGPITYDIASLLRDAFLSWEEDFCLDVTIRYWEKARKAGLPVGDDFGEFYKGVEWMGLQRHLKIAGIFARLSIRDGKPHYLADTPRFIAYIRTTCSRYMELKPLLRLVERIEGIEVPNAYAFGRT